MHHLLEHINPNYEQIVSKIHVYPAKIDTEALYLDLEFSIVNGTVSSINYDKRDHFNFEFSVLSIYHTLFVLREHVLSL